MIITELISTIGGVAAVIAAVFTVILYILATKKTTVILTFSNAEDKIECKVGEDKVLHFLLKNTGNIPAHNVEAVIYYPKGLQPATRNNTQPEKVEYFMHPKERVVLKVKSLPPKSNPITRHTSSIRPNKPGIYEFNYEITGEKVKRKGGKLLLEAKS
ncbi:MAG: hypothetical protein ACTSV6_00215 [Candidatus Heimdallarchaeota archaeon]